MFILDVSFETFMQFKSRGFGFYWTENPTDFILAKPDGNNTVRCTLAKSFDNEKDNALRMRFNTLGVFAEKITFFDSPKKELPKLFTPYPNLITQTEANK